jgi:tRNA (cytidine/uridine-2'-O-)-methyltransferase
VFHIALYQPEIPPNTGNIIRLCANTGVQLHLIHPLGFAPNNKQLERAGLDYHAWAQVKHYENYAAFIQELQPRRLFAATTHGKKNYSENAYEPEDVFLFGPETRGLPKELLLTLPADHLIRIPMVPSSRSLNLSNAAAVVIFEAWRQQNFAGNC